MEEDKMSKNAHNPDSREQSSSVPDEELLPQSGEFIAPETVPNRVKATEAGLEEGTEATPAVTEANLAEENLTANEISALQDLIESGDDLELPDTTAGGLTGNEGTGFVTLNRTGDETLARAGYDTAGQENTLLPRGDLLQDTLQPTVTQSDENIGEEEQTLTGNVLDNDSDADDVLTVQSYTLAGDASVYAAGQTASVEGGSLTVNSDGSYSFIPANNWNGTLPVISYATNTGATDTLTLTLTPVSDLSDGDEAVSTNEDTAVSGNVLANAGSEDGIPEVISFTVSDINFAAGTAATLEQGILTINPDGSYTFIPGDNFNGDVPVVTYSVFDGINTETSTLTIEVLPVSDLSDGDESVITNEDTEVSGNVLANAGSTDGIPEVTGFTVSGTSFDVGTAAILEQGALTVNRDGSYSFVPSDNFNGDVPVVAYTVFDGINTETSTLTIEVLPVSDLSDEDESVSTNEDTAVSGNVLDNAASSDGIPGITDFSVAGISFGAGTTATLEQGALTLNSDGSYTFVPSDNFNGDVPVVTYTVFDGINTETSTLTIEVLPVSDLSDGNESVSTNEDTAVSGNILNNAISSDGTPEITGFSVANTNFEVGTAAVLQQGILTINSDGSYIFVPSDNFNGNVPVVTYTVFDGINNDTSTLTINVTPVSDLNDGNESVSTNEDTPVSGNVLANAGSSDGTPQVTGFSISGTSFSIGSTVSLEQGLLTLNSDGSYHFIPADNFHGNVPVTTYTVFDGVNTDTSTLTINVLELNAEPVAEDDSFSVNQGETVTGNVISHDDGDGITDIEPDGVDLTVSQVNGIDLIFGVDGFAEVDIQDGTLRINAQGDFSYSNSGFVLGSNPPDFTYTLTNGTDSDTATVTINVLDAAPQANDDRNYVLLQQTDDGKADGNSVRGNIIDDELASSGDRADTSPDGVVILSRVQFNDTWYTFGVDMNSHEIATDYGTLTIFANGQYLFEPQDGMDMPDGRQELVFNYEIIDGDLHEPETDTATLTIEIRPPAPTLTDGNEVVSTNEDTPVSGNVLLNTGDASGTPQVTSFTVLNTAYAAGAVALLEQGSLTIDSDGSYSFIPADNFYGDVPQVSYSVSDGSNTDTSTLTISVSPDNDKPVAADDSFSLIQGQTIGGNVISHDDGDGVTDHDADSASLSVTQVNGQDLVFGADGYADIAVEGGNLRINAQGDFSYSNTGFILGSSLPGFDYTLSDGSELDTATVTFNVEDSAPVANDDTNYILLQAAGGGKGVGTSVRGNILSENQASSGDRADSSPDGTVILSQIHFNGTWYSFDAAGSHRIETEYGALTIWDSGEYVFDPIGLMDMPSESLLLAFDYETKDGDNLHPETDTATLTIEIRPPVNLVRPEAEIAEPGEHLIQAGDQPGLLETTLAGGTLIDVYAGDANQVVADLSQPENSYLELGDVLTLEVGNTLDQYLSATMGEGEDDNPEQASNRDSEDSSLSSPLGGSESLPIAPPLDELNSPDVLS
ncbi:tandem-95 repeat protein [Thalassomonas viridans]|uniref:Tandem-95 repeat protein n=1 Tax=Thalassomonas viridans TaxID=137584 RepID=A0AAE9Z9I5_9GAMM|nr:Ig-like domain-containing protein [Thalassomonas viridans]WDE08525.1 tandem-95 repeat protein [Thalassomonas viridans]